MSPSGLHLMIYKSLKNMSVQEEKKKFLLSIVT